MRGAQVTDETYAVYAVQYARVDRRSRENFTDGDPHDTEMPLYYYVWVISGRDRTIVVDTGFDEEVARRRGRQIVRPVSEGLRALGVAPEAVEDVVITHMHYDHCGNRGLFPRARYHLQEAELEYATGRAMCHRLLRAAYEADDVVEMVRRVFDERVQFHAGTGEIAPGVTVHHIGGHTRGMQAVRVRTRRGWVVLASDASHFYAHIEQRRAFPVLYNLYDVLAGYDRVRSLASSAAHIVPGHDPLVMARYPAASPETTGWIARLDVDPVS